MKQLLGALALFIFIASPVSAITVDGNLIDWGVNPFHDWNANGTNIAQTVHDNKTGDEVAGGLNIVDIRLTEDWDVEAMYAQITESTLNFAIVTSRDQRFGLGDLAISLYKDGEEDNSSVDKKYEFGVDITGFGASNNVVNRGVYAVTDWKTKHGKEYNFPMEIKAGNYLGNAQVIQKYVGEVEPGKHGYFAKTYILEGIVDLDLLGITEICELNFELAFAKVSCLRDYAVVKGKCDGPCEIPEPSSVLLLGSALVGFGRFRKKRA